MVKDSIKIVALGDSVTEGAGLLDVTEDTAFPRVLERELNEQLGRPVEVINSGVGGDVTSGALERFDRDVLAHSPDYTAVMFGVNDAGFYRPATDGFADAPRLTAEEFRGNVRAITDRLLAARIKPVLITAPPMTSRYWGAHLGPYQERGINFLTSQYAQIVRDVAAERDVPLVDAFVRFEQDAAAQETLLDGLHPDARGHAIIAELLAAWFVEELSSASPPSMYAARRED